MATLRGSSNSYDVGNKPPQVTWTVVRGDTAAFKVYATDDAKVALDIPEWDIKMDIKRSGSLVVSLTPVQEQDDAAGEFTVSLTADQSEILETGDVFDIQLTRPSNVWTIAQGSMVIIEDVTD